jgi:hypothetical protein
MNEKQQLIRDLIYAIAELPGADGIRISWEVDGVEEFESFPLYEIPENMKPFPATAKEFLIDMRGDTLAASDFDIRNEYSRILIEHGISEIPDANFRIPKDEYENEFYRIIFRI